MMIFLSILLLIISGIILLLIEAVLLPGVTIAAVLSFASFAYSIYLGYCSFGVKGAVGTTIIILIVTPIALYKVSRSKFASKMKLNRVSEGTASDKVEKVATLEVGMSGKSISRLAPIGNAEFNDTVLEVKSQGSFIPQGTDIKIITIEGSTVIVSPISKLETDK